jgi:signal transduction histidine kinase
MHTQSSTPLVSAKRRRIPLLAIFIFWTCWSLWSFQQNLLVIVVSGRHVESWLRPLLLALSSGWFWALLTPLIMLYTRSAADRSTSRVRLILSHFAFFLVLHVIDCWYYSHTTAAWAPAPRPFEQLLLSLTTTNLWTYALIAVVTTLVDYYDALRERNLRAERLEAQLAHAQFQALRAQLHPHFLFNALNAISALIHKDPARADRMLARLSELLRLAIDTAGSPEVKLIDEVDFVNRYLEIERMRFGERLDVRVTIPADTYDALVPNMLLQPIVENAVRHGVAPLPGPGRVEIVAQRNGSHLGIVVRDSGNGIHGERVPNESRGGGVGLSATRDRLQQLYGNDQELSLVNIPGGFETRLRLPYRRKPAPLATA